MVSQHIHYTTEVSKRRLEKMQQNANQLFSLGGLRKQLWEAYQHTVAQTPAAEYGNYNLLSNREIRFAWELISSYRTTLKDIRDTLDNAFEGQNPLQELQNDREGLILDFASIGFSNNWEHVMTKPDAWRTFARRIPFDTHDNRHIEKFFTLLDQISIITDILCGHAKEYGLEVDDSLLKQLDDTTDSIATDDAVLKLLDSLVGKAIKEKKTPKYILLPIRAAKDAEVLPTYVDRNWVNAQYNLSLSPMNWSTWVNDEKANYDLRELNHDITLFENLKTKK